MGNSKVICFGGKGIIIFLAWTGILQYQAKPVTFSQEKVKAIDINPNYRIDDVEVYWK